MERDDKKPNTVDKYDKRHKELKEGEAPNNPATNNNVPFDEGQWETEKEIPHSEGKEEDK